MSMNHCNFYGTVSAGLGEGKKFISMPGYSKQFKEKLGFNPFPGTLNLKVRKDFVMELLDGLKMTRIEGFEENGKEFGGVCVFQAKLNSIKVYLVLPDINKHEEKIEFISPDNLREKLNLKDDDMVKVGFLC